MRYQKLDPDALIPSKRQGRVGKRPFLVFLEGMGSAIRLCPRPYEIRGRDRVPPIVTAARKLAHRGQKIRAQIFETANLPES